jgi:hypothetical protein
MRLISRKFQSAAFCDWESRDKTINVYKNETNLGLAADSAAAAAVAGELSLQPAPRSEGLLKSRLHCRLASALQT